jgi:cullin 1
MAILLLFNNSDTITYDEMFIGTKLSKVILDPSTSVFVKANVLLAQPEGAKPNFCTTYKLNVGFKPRKKKISFNISIKSEQQQKANDIYKTIKEDRKLLMQAGTYSLLLHYLINMY